MSIRHQLIRWLSCGDMVVLNAEFLADGTIRTREAGDSVMANFHVSSRADIGLSVGAPPLRAALMIETTPTQHLSLIDVGVNYSGPYRVSFPETDGGE